MTYSNTFKLLQEASAIVNKEDQLSVLRNKPFWIWDQQHSLLQVEPDSQCCFNHLVGLPQYTKGRNKYDLKLSSHDYSSDSSKMVSKATALSGSDA
jgi:hypothetical protein